MRLSAPIYRLKRRAKILARAERIPLNQALDRLAREEGFNSWSLLVARVSAVAPASALLTRLAPGDLVLLGARPGHGKTLMGLELIVEAMKSGRRGVFFTFEYNKKDIFNRFPTISAGITRFRDRFEFEDSDAISADYIINYLTSAPQRTVVVIDYLQLLDQRRENPALMVQICALKSFARDRGLILVFISQIDRSYDPLTKPCPSLEDVRLPNPLDLTLFNKTCFLHDGEVQIEAS